MAARRTTAALLLSTLLLPAAASAQQRRGPSAFATLTAAVGKVDLTDDQKQKVDAVVKAGQADIKAAVADAQAGPEDERAAKMADVQRQFDDLVGKVEAEMPATQRPKFESARASATLDATKTQVEAVRAAAAAADLTDEQKAAVKAAFVEVDKVLDGSAVDAAEAVQPQDVSVLQTDLAASVGGLQKALVDGVGRDKAIAILKDAAGRAGK